VSINLVLVNVYLYFHMYLFS